jgi:hypothetical protein
VRKKRDRDDIVEAVKRLLPPRSEVIPGLPIDDRWTQSAALLRDDTARRAMISEWHRD